jgi:von Willebrand factor type D domain
MKRSTVVLVIAVLASACTGGSDATTTTATETVPTSVSSTKTGSLIDAALGTQTVQDFIIQVDLAVQGEDGTRSIYQEVLDRANSGTTEFYDLKSGLYFSPVSTIDGHVIDSDRAPLTSLSVDFGILGLTNQALEQVKAESLAGLLPGNQPLADLIGGVESSPGLLVEIVTADLTDGYTHLGPGDQVGFNIEFVDGVSVGDHLTSAYLFGQTLPGDPVQEEGLTPTELFAYRWANGLINILGNESPTLTVDDSLTARQGSVILDQDVKEKLLAGRYKQAGDRAKDRAIQLLQDAEVEQGVEPNSTPVCLLALDTPGQVSCAVEVSPDQVPELAWFVAAFDACLTLASHLNNRNERGGISAEEYARHVVEIDPLFKVLDTPMGREQLEKWLKGDGRPGSDPPPGPVSCFPPDDTPLEGPPKTGTTFGDVHVATFDGLGYDAHSVGEFLVFDNDAIEVQMRLEPIEIAQGASIVTAVALRVGDHTVSLHPIGETWIDARRASLERGSPVSLGDAELVRTQSQWIIVTADGTVVEVSDNVAETTDSMVLMIRPSPRPSIGMFGSPDDNSDNDLVTRDGVQIEPQVRFDYDTFYSTFVDSWRITSDESLFHYESGETTDSFLIDGFPQSWLTVADFEDATRSDAELTCAEMGITREGLLDACIFDVALTGKPAYAYQSFMVQARTPDPAALNTSEAPTSGLVGLTVGPFTMALDPSSSDKWLCQVSDGIFRVQASRRETADRELDLTVEHLDTEASGTGTEKLTITAFLNGSPYAWLTDLGDAPVGTVETLKLDSGTLTATGKAFLNEPLDPAISLLTPIPESEWKPFTLQVSCDP